MGIENTILSGATQADIKRECVMALDFRDREQLRRIGATVYGEPVVNRGFECDGINDRITIQSGATFPASGFTFEISYTPNDDHTTFEVIYDAYTSSSVRFLLYKISNVLYAIIGATQIVFGTLDTSSWLLGKKNLISVSASSGDSTIYLNGDLFASDSVAFSTVSPQNQFVCSNNSGAELFSGIIHSIKIFHAVKTEQEHIDAYQNQTYRYMKDAIVNLPMTEDWYNSGSGLALDASGNDNDGTLESTVEKLPTRGFYFPGVSSSIDLTGVASSGNSFTVVLLAELYETGATQFIWDFQTTRLALSLNSGVLKIYDGTYHATTLASGDGVSRTYIVTGDASGLISLYVDGFLILEYSRSPSNIAGGAAIGSSYVGTASTKMNAREMIVIDRSLTPTQAHDLHLRLMSGIGTVNAREAITASGSTLTPSASIEIDPGETGLVWGANMRPTGNKIIDLSSGGNDGTIVGAMHGRDALGDFLTSDGSATVTSGNVGTIKSVSSWINIATTTEDVFDFDGGTHTVEATSGTLSATGFATPSIFIDGVETTTITSGLHHILISTSTGFAASSFVCALQTGKTYSTKLNSEEKTIYYAKREYNKGAIAL